MARRSIWKGVVSFGMVAIPIKMYTATESKDIAFVTLHKSCLTRLRQKRWCPYHEAEVPADEVVRGYEYAKEQYVVMDDKDFENLPVTSVHTIEITQFVSLEDIDPMNFERSYVLEPEGVGVKPFYLLKQALENTKRIAVGKVALRQKEHICCLRPYGEGLAIHTMFYADEIRGNKELSLPEEKTAITEAEMGMATMLIDQLTRPYDPDAYQDEYRIALERVIEAKLLSQEPVTAAPHAPKGKVTDLMEALKQSIAAVQQQQAGRKAQPAEAPTEDAEEEKAKEPAASRKRTRAKAK